MRFYTNAQVMGNNILYSGYHNGKKIRKKIAYSPYLFVPSPTPTDYRTLDDKFVKKQKFDSIHAAKDFIRDHKDIANFSVYGYDKFVYPMLNDLYPKEVEFDPSLIKVGVIDIECKMGKEGFDDFITKTEQPITAITIRVKNRTFAFGYKELIVPEDPKVRYIHCKDEYNLLERFLSLWESLDLDVVTGWNVEFFDMPYIVNRITKVLGDYAAKRLSPWGFLLDKDVNVFGKYQKTFTPVGIAVLDYMQLYKKFTYTQQESYSLNHIAYVELGAKKVDYSEYENLDELYEKDFNKYMIYNIQDVDLVYELDEKHKLLELIFTMAYSAKINYNDSLATVLPWEVVIHNYLMERKIVMPYKSRNRFAPYEGAYVKQPLVGMHEWGMSFDLVSLYPHLIMQYNISPETYVSKKPDVDVLNILHGVVKNDTEYSMAANGCLYSKEKQGFLPALMEQFFAKRKEYKGKLKEAKALKAKGEDVDNDIARYQNAQMAMKIFLNSAYGAIGNQYFIFYNNDNAEAITISGQLSIRWVEKDTNAYLNKLSNKNMDYNIAMDNYSMDYIIAMDTDSMYLRLGEFVKDVPEASKTKYLDWLAETKIQPEIKKSYERLAKVMNAYKNVMQMNRENIYKKAIWKAKKMYILNVVDEEGIQHDPPKLKMMGVETVRSSIPEVCRDALKSCYKIIMNQENDALIAYLEDFRKKYEEFSFGEISSPRSVNGITKYSDPDSIYKKGTPIHVRGTLLYNHLLRTQQLTYPKIYEGDKIKFVYLSMPNPIQSDTIASPGYLPEEFGIDKYIDRQKQYEKTFLKPLQSITDVIGWKVEESYNLEDFFE